MRPRGENRRVLLISHSSNLSGAPISLAQLARKLMEHGYSPLYLIPRHGPIEEMLGKWGVRYEVLRRSIPVLDFLRVMRRENPCIVHVNSLVKTWPVLLARLAGKPVLWHVREYLGEKRGYARLIHLLANRAVLISKDQYRLFEGLGRSVYIPNAVDMEIFEKVKPSLIPLAGIPGENPAGVPGGGHEGGTVGIAPRAPAGIRAGMPAEVRTGARVKTVVAYVGSIEPRKGLVVLARAALILKEKSWIHFVVIGEAPGRFTDYLNEVEEVVKGGGLGERFRFLGRRADVPELLQSAHILCHPAYVEAFGRVVLEAMASKLPVVASRIGEIRTIVEDGKTGLLFEPGDARALARAIDRLDSDRKLGRTMGRAGYEKVKREYSLDLHARRVVEVYEGMLERSGS